MDKEIREEEQPILSPADLGWLDEGIRHSDKSDGDGGDDDDGDGSDEDDGGDGSNDEGTYGVRGSQRSGAMTWDSDYATQDTDHGG